MLPSIIPIQRRLVGPLERPVVGTMQWWEQWIGANLTSPAPHEPPMTIALLIALAGSLAAMAVIVRRLEQR